MVSLSQLYYTMVESRYVKHTLLPCPVRNISSEYPDIGDKAPALSSGALKRVLWPP